jgi:enamidase
MSSLGIINVGCLVTGEFSAPLAAAESIRVEQGRVVALGPVAETGADQCDSVLDAAGTTVAPGLIDSHVHTVFGDWTPRQNMTGWIESYLQGGITSMMSASEVHLPGRPRDRAGLKALAITAQRSFANHRPAGVKVHAGSVILEPCLEPADFSELRSQGVWLAKMGFGAFAANQDAVPLVRAARAEGFVVMCHTGGVSIPGSNTLTAEDLIALEVDIAGHVNGGTTALPDAGLERLIRHAHPGMRFQISQAGNLRSALRVLALAAEAGRLQHVLISSDTPTGTGVIPLGVLKSVAELSSLGGIAPAVAWAMATGNNAAVLRQNTGRIAVGREADLVVIDAPAGSAFGTAMDAVAGGDLPGISAVVIDGELKVLRSRNTPLASRLCRVLRGGGPRP